MLTLFTIYFFILGIIIGSFLNVVILRHNTGKSTGGRSSCMSCKTQLTWKNLVPVLSFIFQKGRCSTCKTRLSWQYPLVELSTGILFAVNFYFLFQQAVSITQLIISVGFSSCILALMIVIFVYDLRHKIIPDVFSWSMFGVSVVWILSTVIPAKAGIQSYDSWIPAFAGMTNWGVGMMNSETRMTIMSEGTTLLIINLLAGIIFYLGVYMIWKLSKGRMIGLGDAKLLLTIGTVLGFVYGLSSIFIAVWTGTFYAVYLLLKERLSNKGKHITMKTEIPFGPFLIVGFLIVYFFHIDVTNLGFILENFS